MPASVLLAPEGKRVAELYALGYSTPQIARELGRSRKAVRTGLKHLGILPRSRTEGYREWLRLRGGKGTKAKLNTEGMQ